MLTPLFLGLYSGKFHSSYTLPNHKTTYEKSHLLSPWADKIFDTLSLDQKIGQMFMIPIYPDKPKSVKKAIQLIKKYNIGGVIIFKGSASKIKQITDTLNKLSKIPLFIAMDAEWGAAMRVRSAVPLPMPMTLGAITDNRLIYQAGKLTALQLKALGINTNFAPNLDVNSNPLNPIIGMRSFGSNPYLVTSKAFAFFKGLSDQGILAVAKHFPGHGNTSSDSHSVLPYSYQSWKQLKNCDLIPYKQLIHAGLKAILVAHVNYPKIYDLPNTPASLSPTIVHDILQDSLKFNGLIFTDALNMKAVTKFFSPQEAAIRAILAGNNILLMPQNIPQTFTAIKQAILFGSIPQSLIDSSVKKILYTKALFLQFKNKHKLNPQKLLFSDSIKYFSSKLFQKAITLIQNNNNIIPITHLERHNIACVNFSKKTDSTFSFFLNLYTKVDTFNLPTTPSNAQLLHLASKLAPYDIIIIALASNKPFNPPLYGFSQKIFRFIDSLAQYHKIILNAFAPPYLINQITHPKKIQAILISYQNNQFTKKASAQIIFGGLPALGSLPVKLNHFPVNTRITTKKIRLSYLSPWALGINPKDLIPIDSIVDFSIADHIFPGCQILAVKDTTVFFFKSYGFYTYKQKHPVSPFSLYDVASITKVAATTLALMKLYDQGKFDINAKMCKYLPPLCHTNKKNMKIIDVLTHQARLIPWIPFYLHTYLPNSHKLDPKLYSNHFSPKYPIHVADSLYLIYWYPDTMYNQIYHSKLIRHKRYLYSDLGFYMFKKIIKNISDTSLDTFVRKNFYIPLGANYTVFNPLKYFPKQQIVPSENDTYFRHQIIQGYVQDYGAAMLGGVSGNAGLFSNANDLAKIFQMLLQYGYYADRQYIKPSTVKKFTTKPFKYNPRALGFDSKNKYHHSLAATSASLISYGHTGFTGCMIWADPKYNFIFVFLSNRVFPDVLNQKINHFRIRTKIHQIFYNAIFNAYENKNYYIRNTHYPHSLAH